MSREQDILDQLGKGIPPQQVAKNFLPLTIEERERLLAEAECRSRDKESSEILGGLYFMLRDTDPWTAVRVLALVIATPSLLKTPRQKQVALEQMRGDLDRIRATLSATNTNDICQYKRYEADYYALRAKVCLESSKIDEAKRYYGDALSIYREHGPNERAGWAQQQIARIERIETDLQQLLPLQGLESKWLSRQAELADLTVKLKERQKTLDNIQAEIGDAKVRKAELDRQISTCEQKRKEYEGKAKEVGQERQKLDRQINNQKAMLDFLMELPRAAMAPLWVEVVRLALTQGEMDSLVQQAVERLSVKFPAEAMPLLAEIAARSTAPDQTSRFQMVAPNWMALIVQAQDLKDQNLAEAARFLVQAWDGFFQVMGQVDSHA